MTISATHTHTHAPRSAVGWKQNKKFMQHQFSAAACQCVQTVQNKMYMSLNQWWCGMTDFLEHHQVLCIASCLQYKRAPKSICELSFSKNLHLSTIYLQGLWACLHKTLLHRHYCTLT